MEEGIRNRKIPQTNPLKSENTGILSNEEMILDEISQIYTKDEVGLISISKHKKIRSYLNNSIFCPRKKVDVKCAVKRLHRCLHTKKAGTV